MKNVLQSSVTSGKEGSHTKTQCYHIIMQNFNLDVTVSNGFLDLFCVKFLVVVWVTFCNNCVL